MKNTKALLFFLGIFSSNLYSFDFLFSGILYGEDGRVEGSSLELGSQAKLLSASVALVLEKSKLKKAVCSRYYSLETEEFGSSYKLCEEERFYKQETAGFCTGFLISDDTVLTAAHCFESKEDCGELAFLFDYEEEEKKLSSKRGKRILSKDLFFCKEVFFPQRGGDKKSVDLAVIKLDRKVRGRAPLLFSSDPLVGNEEFYVPGHPYGLPLKVAYGGRVLENYDESIFTASLDTYSGNSGSPVLYEGTGLVAGMLVRGADDFVLKGDCYQSARCEEGFCKGEEVLRSHVIHSLVSPLL